LSKHKRRQRPPAAPPIAPPRGARAATIALALSEATGPDGRERARAHIRECGSPVVAARDVFLAYAEAAEQPDPRYAVACRSGCWFCCTTPVAVTVFEAAMVKSAVLTLPEPAQRAIWDRLQAHVAGQDQAIADADGRPTAFRQRCPLLDDQGQCSVYAGRPLACRGLLSLDAERCRRAFLEGDQGDPGAPFTLTNNAAIAGVPHLMVTLNEGQLDHYPSYELASTLYKLWAEPESFNAWQRGELFAQAGRPRMAEGAEIFPTPPDLPIGPPQ